MKQHFRGESAGVIFLHLPIFSCQPLSTPTPSKLHSLKPLLLIVLDPFKTAWGGKKFVGGGRPDEQGRNYAAPCWFSSQGPSSLHLLSEGEHRGGCSEHLVCTKEQITSCFLSLFKKKLHSLVAFCISKVQILNIPILKLKTKQNTSLQLCNFATPAVSGSLSAPRAT